MFWLDHARNGARGTPNAVEVVTVSLLLGASGFLAFFNARRTRELVLEGAEKTLLAERARARLGAYVSDEVAAASLLQDELRFDGVRQQVAILFSDLRGFTSMSEHADPSALVAELNEYLEAMVAAIRGRGGVVDKYIGDSVMAVFGAPLPRTDDALRAMWAARDMDVALAKLNERRLARGRIALRHGIGVHVGDVIAGNIGTRERAQYTVIGDAVNTAARLESATKEQGVRVLLSAALVAQARAAGEIPSVREVGALTVKGRAEAIRAFSFVDVEG